MKAKSTSSSPLRAFTVLESLAALVILSILVTGALGVVHFMKKSTIETRLQTQVQQLNSAASIYEANGGSLANIDTVDAALAKMKTVASESKRSRIAGLRGSVIDNGLRAVMLTAAEVDGTDARAVWVPATRRFEMVVSGMGVKYFEVDPELALADRIEEDRTAPLLLAAGDGWVWDYQDFNTGAARDVSIDLYVESGKGSTGSPYPEPLRLNPPVFSLPEGSYDYMAFNLPVYLTNENPTASSLIIYTLGDGDWHQYDGRAIMVGPNSRLTAYTAANDPENWMDSAQESALYRSTFQIRGEAGGKFHDAVGGSNMVTGGQGGFFTWGSAAGTPDPSWLLFNGASFLDVNPEERFLLGEVSYYNGTIWSGTGANSVGMDLSLAFGGTSQKYDFTYSLDLINTQNLASNTLDQNADYVRFGNIRSETPMTLGGIDYTLVLEFGETTANGFSTIDQFFVHEDRMATGRLYGTLIKIDLEADVQSGAEPIIAAQAPLNVASDLANALAGK
jgi:type II secretory pathway pseudopilin PulG